MLVHELIKELLKQPQSHPVILYGNIIELDVRRLPSGAVLVGPKPEREYLKKGPRDEPPSQADLDDWDLRR